MYKIINNGEAVKLSEIPVLGYAEFASELGRMLASPDNHCLNYYAVPFGDKLRWFAIVANDALHNIALLSHETPNKADVVRPSLSAEHFPLHIFEREIHENFGVRFDGHPWLKPVRYAHNRADVTKVMDNYPFFKIGGHDLLEVGVGPIHAGIIEPGHFRFICNGEKVLHLEIHLGYQHRGVEKLFVEKSHPLQQCVLAETIAGDSSVSHALAYVGLLDAFDQTPVPAKLLTERAIALEMERIALHMADTAALSTDVAYQLGQVVNEALRTVIINTTQFWCGNRFGKGLIRPNGSYYPIDSKTSAEILKNISDVEKRYLTMANRIFDLPSILERFEGVGEVTREQARLVGAVGMAARTCGLSRDIRASHPTGIYKQYTHEPQVLASGDVMARAMLRKLEAVQSINLVKKWLGELSEMDSTTDCRPNYNIKLPADSIAVSAVEGWRGEICHSAITGSDGQIVHYKVKDPSMHNWMALALAVRNQEISDFPICNKSFNLSYCGYDL
jgi:Ni,Fe-hydrogenase III large subunit